MKTKSLTLLVLSWVAAVQGEPRSSANYSIPSETTDIGGSLATSTSYANDGSAGLIAGLATGSSPMETVKAGYLGQLYEVIGLTVTATPASVDETATRQLSAWQKLDDDSYLAVSAATVAWQVEDGPITSISTSGLATAGPVYQDTSASVQGSFAGLTDVFSLTVRDTLPDNFGSYAGDGLDDSWQNQYFGLNNPLAGPLMDPDADSQNNQFEFTAGLVPTDPMSRFLLRVEPVADQPTHKRLIFSPRFEDRSYKILTSTSLSGGIWTALTDGIINDDGDERTVTDPNATEGAKFYRVGISRP